MAVEQAARLFVLAVDEAGCLFAVSEVDVTEVAGEPPALRIEPMKLPIGSSRVIELAAVSCRREKR